MQWANPDQPPDRATDLPTQPPGQYQAMPMPNRTTGSTDLAQRFVIAPATRVHNWPIVHFRATAFDPANYAQSWLETYKTYAVYQPTVMRPPVPRCRVNPTHRRGVTYCGTDSSTRAKTPKYGA